MKEFEFVVTDPQGIHARPAGLWLKKRRNLNPTSAYSKAPAKAI